MKNLLLASFTGFVLASGSALAADMPLKAPPPPPPPVYNWTGCYVSAGVGYGMWNQEHYGETNPGLIPLTNTFTSGGQGWLGRVGAGCDYQIAPTFLVGVFGDYDFMNVKSQNFADVSGVGSKENESGSSAIGVRLGYLPYPNLLTFVSAGWTQAHFDRQELFDTVAFPAVPLGAHMDAHNYNGGFVGGGYEYRLPWMPALTWKTEYRYDWYGAADLPIILDTGAPTGAGEHSSKTVQTITTGLTWRFNFGGPVVSRY